MATTGHCVIRRGYSNRRRRFPGLTATRFPSRYRPWVWIRNCRLRIFTCITFPWHTVRLVTLCNITNKPVLLAHKKETYFWETDGCIIPRSLYTIYRTAYVVHYTTYTIRRTLYSVHYTTYYIQRCTIRCVIYDIHYALNCIYLE